MIDPGEAALAHVGLTSVLKKDVPRIGVEAARQIATFDQQVVELAKALVAGELPAPTLPREHSYRATLDRLSKKLSHEELADIGERFIGDSQELLGPFTIALTNAYEHVRTLFPKTEYVTYAGPINLVPDSDAVWNFFLRLQVINDPLQVFPLMASGALLQPQVQTVREFYPTLAKAIGVAIQDEVAEAKARKSSYRLPPLAEIGVAQWLARRTVEFQPTPPKKVIPQIKRPNPRATRALESPGQMTANRSQ